MITVNHLLIIYKVQGIVPGHVISIINLPVTKGENSVGKIGTWEPQLESGQKKNKNKNLALLPCK